MRGKREETGTLRKQNRKTPPLASLVCRPAHAQAAEKEDATPRILTPPGHCRASGTGRRKPSWAPILKTPPPWALRRRGRADLRAYSTSLRAACWASPVLQTCAHAQLSAPPHTQPRLACTCTAMRKQADRLRERKQTERDCVLPPCRAHVQPHKPPASHTRTHAAR
jgi:hypothetical protein